MDIREEMLAVYRRACDANPGLARFHDGKKNPLWGVMGFFALLRLLEAALYWRAGHPAMAVCRALLGLVLPGIFALSVWRGNWKLSFLLLIPGGGLAVDLAQSLRAVLLVGPDNFVPLYLAILAVEAVTVLYLLGVLLWLTLPAKNRELSLVMNQVTEEMIRRTKQMTPPPGGMPQTPPPAPPAERSLEMNRPAPPKPEPASPEIPSFYQQIRAAAGPEGLPPGFSLQRPQKEGEETRLRFADGAPDGIAMYHTNVTPGDDGPLHEILGLISAGYLAAGERLEAFFAPGGPTMLPLIDGLQGWLGDHREEIDPGMLYRFSLATLRESRSPECVKFALSLLELLQPTEESREVVSTLALSDEFTLFCLYVIRTWEDGGAELFRLAKLVHGWGRIFLVHELPADTPEVRRWLLTEGWDNSVLAAYSARLCAQRGGLMELLERDTLTREEYAAASGLVAALLDEGPVRNISAMEEGPALLEAFLRHAAMAETDDQRQTVEDVRQKLRDMR